MGREPVACVHDWDYASRRGEAVHFSRFDGRFAMMLLPPPTQPRGRIDEIPQAWNVLRGDMSRPERVEFVQLLSDLIPGCERRHLLRPGITGWAQVNQRHSGTLEEARLKHAYDRARELLRRFRFAPIRHALSFSDLPVFDGTRTAGVGGAAAQ